MQYLFFKQVTILFLLLANFSVFANQKILSNYTELLEALSNGHEVRAIMRLDKCHSNSTGSKSTNAPIGGLNFTQFNKYPVLVGDQLQNVIATSTHMLVRSAEYGPIYNYVRLRVFENGQAEMFSEYLNPKDYAQIKQASFTCHLSTSTEQNAITLYDLTA